LARGSDPGEAICSYAHKSNIDTLFLGRRGLGTIKRLFLGSVSRYCIENAICNIVVIKHPEDPIREHTVSEAKKEPHRLLTEAELDDE
jgi:Universal stress protein family